MAIPWQGNFEIKVGGKSPQASHGPSLAVLSTRLYMAYVGTGGDNLWYSYLDAASDFEDWQGNQQIVTVTNGAPLATARPALAAVNGILHMVYVGKGGSELWWSWFDGNTWQGNLPLGLTIAEGAPTLAEFDDKLHLMFAIVDPIPRASGILHSVFDPSLPFVASSWKNTEAIESAIVSPAVASFQGQMYLIANEDTPSPMVMVFGSQNNWSIPTELSVGKSVPTSKSGVALASYQPGGEAEPFLYLIYPGHNGSNLLYLVIDQNNNTAGNTQIKTATSTPETNGSLGAAVFKDCVCVAYKGQSSKSIFFSYRLGAY